MTDKQQNDFLNAQSPFELFTQWFADAKNSEINDYNAMALATIAQADNRVCPNVRMVLLKGYDQSGFVFYTNYESAKGQELLETPYAALCFHWKSLRRQIRIRGPIASVCDKEADDYFASRPRGSRIGAWASKQSRQLESRFALEKAAAKYGAKYTIGKIPRPPYWSGFKLTPLEIEFWHDRPFRLHDRLQFSRKKPADDWTIQQLYP